MATNSQASCSMSSQSFGTIDGREATLWILRNNKGMNVSIMDFGATITSIRLPAKNNQLIECVLGFNHAEEYASDTYRCNNPHLGAIIGRHAGRISHARANLNQQIIQLSTNLEQHHLHGGYSGFDQHWWEVLNQHSDAQAATLTLHLFSPDGDEGYPGNLNVWATYTLTDKNELKVNLRAQSDKDTFLNLTQHSYFNLSAGQDSIKQHQLWLLPQRIIATDQLMMPTGELIAAPASLDFHSVRPIGNSIIDTAYILPAEHSSETIVAKLSSADTGLTLSVTTDAPVLVVYNAEHLPQQTITNRQSLQPFAAICFEPQGYSDAPNQPTFPNNILKKGTTFSQDINYIFYTAFKPDNN